MFGATIDYWLLRPLAHARNRATEAELDRRAGQEASFDLADAAAYLQKVSRFFDGQLAVRPELSYLDIGCGMGRLCFGLAAAGAREVVGVDVVPRHVEQARAIAARLDLPVTPRFVCADIHRWPTERRYDVITVVGVMEHVREPARFLAALPRLLNPGGVALIGHEPFQSPIGDHLRDFFRVQIPWRGLLFSEQALLRLRREFYRPTDPAQRLPEIVGGLNLMSYSAFLRNCRAAGLRIGRVNFNPQLRRYPPAYHAFSALTRLPAIRDYFIIGAYAAVHANDSATPPR